MVVNMIDVEIKAKFDNHEKVRRILKERNAEFRGIDKQIDVYFNTKTGRLKLRKGEIENILISYSRENIKDIKPSDFILYKSTNPLLLEKMLKSTLGELISVEKKREIYYIDNVKFNLDEVKGLGKFVEIEAMTDNPKDIPKLRKVVEEYIQLFDISKSDIQSHSYSDLLLEKQ